MKRCTRTYPKKGQPLAHSTLGVFAFAVASPAWLSVIVPAEEDKQKRCGGRQGRNVDRQRPQYGRQKSPGRGRSKRSNGRARYATTAQVTATQSEKDGRPRATRRTGARGGRRPPSCRHTHRATPPDARTCTPSLASWWVAAPPNMGATGSPREGGFHGGGCGVRAHGGVASCAVGATSGTAARD